MPIPFKMKDPWQGKDYRCQGYDDQGNYGNGYGSTPAIARANWSNNLSRAAAIIKQQNEECRIYLHNRKKYDK